MNTWDTSWGTSWGDSWGIGLAVEEGIALAALRPPNVDFIIQGRYITPNIPATQKVINLGIRRAERDENKELREMMQIYSLWRKAA